MRLKKFFLLLSLAVCFVQFSSILSAGMFLRRKRFDIGPKAILRRLEVEDQLEQNKVLALYNSLRRQKNMPEAAYFDTIDKKWLESLEGEDVIAGITAISLVIIFGFLLARQGR